MLWWPYIQLENGWRQGGQLIKLTRQHHPLGSNSREGEKKVKWAPDKHGHSFWQSRDDYDPMLPRIRNFVPNRPLQRLFADGWENKITLWESNHLMRETSASMAAWRMAVCPNAALSLPKQLNLWSGTTTFRIQIPGILSNLSKSQQ